jgi:hypothetical protein
MQGSNSDRLGAFDAATELAQFPRRSPAPIDACQEFATRPAVILENHDFLA